MPKGWSPQSTTTCSCSPTTARTSMAGWRLTIVASATFGSTSSSSPSRIEPLGFRSPRILESVFSEPRLFLGKLLRRHPRQRANERREHLQLLLGDVVGWPHSVLKASTNSHLPPRSSDSSDNERTSSARSRTCPTKSPRAPAVCRSRTVRRSRQIPTPRVSPRLHQEPLWNQILCPRCDAAESRGYECSKYRDVIRVRVWKLGGAEKSC